MLPFPIFLFLLFSATLLAPPPPVLVGFFKIPTLRSFEWSSLLTSIPDSDPQLPPEGAALFSLGMPSVTLNPSPCCPNSMLVANKTVPHPFVRVTDDRTSCTTVLLVVLLMMFNYFVYRLLVDESDACHDAERKSEQITQSPLSNPATPPQESVYPIYYCTPTVEETPHPFPSVDTTKTVSESLEHRSIPFSAKSPPTPSFATTIPHQSPAPLGESILFPVILHEFLLGNSEKTRDDDSSLSTLSAPGCALIDSPSAAQTAACEAPSALSVEPAARVDDPEVGLPECTPLDTKAAKAVTSPLIGLSNISHSRNPEPSSELQDDNMSSPAIEDTCELDADEQGVFCYQPSNPEGDGDETPDHKEVDSTPEALKTPPAPATEDRALPSPQLRLRSRGHSLDYASSFSARKSASEVVNTRLPSPRFSFLLDRTSEGQSEGEATLITRCASADDLVGTFGISDAVDASITTDCHSPPAFRCDIFDDAAHNQVTTLSLLRADAPIFKPRSPGMNEAVSPESVPLGLAASIHAPENEEILQTQGLVEVLDATTNTPEHPIESSSFQTDIDAVEEPESSGNAQPASPGITDGLRVSIHAPPGPSSGTLQAPGDDTENLEKEPTHSMTRSNSTRSGLYASIHALAAGQTAQRSSKHHTDVPNWAAICRAEKSSTSTQGILPAKCSGDSPDSVAAFDESASELSTTTRCAASDQEGSSVDDSDGSSLVHAGDQEDTTIGSGETDSTPGEVDARVERDSTGTKPSRKSRRRGGRRTRQKIPYVPPPRMQNLPVTQHPVIGVRAQDPGQTPNVLAAPASLSVHHHHPHAPPAPPHHPTSAPGLMFPPNGIMHDQFGRYPHYYPSSPHVAPIPGFQPPSPHNPRFYPIWPHPHVPPHAPSTLLYGR